MGSSIHGDAQLEKKDNQVSINILFTQQLSDPLEQRVPLQGEFTFPVVRHFPFFQKIHNQREDLNSNLVGDLMHQPSIQNVAT